MSAAESDPGRRVHDPGAADGVLPAAQGRAALQTADRVVLVAESDLLLVTSYY